MAERSFAVTGIVLKRTPTGEKDQVITILSQEKGKLVCIAKGIRSLTSSRRGVLEQGSLFKGMCMVTKSMPILTQAQLIAELRPDRPTLSKLRQLTQFLEILDRLFVEEELELELFAQVTELHELFRSETASRSELKAKLQELIESLGFAEEDPDKYGSILEYVAAITEKPMRSYEYLVVKEQSS